MKINCQVSVHKKPVLTETFLTPTSSLSTRSTLSSLVTSTSTWSNKHNPVHEHEPLYGHLCSSGMPLSYNDPNTIPPPLPLKKVMKPATFNRSRYCINFETFFYAVTSTPGIHTRNACTQQTYLRDRIKLFLVTRERVQMVPNQSCVMHRSQGLSQQIRLMNFSGLC